MQELSLAHWTVIREPTVQHSSPAFGEWLRVLYFPPFPANIKKNVSGD
jgi:hypothetical protein